VDTNGARNLDLSLCGVSFLIFMFTMPVGAINFMYFFLSLVICFLVLFTFKNQSGARKAATGTSIISKLGFTHCQNSVWELSTGCISAMELCTQSIVTNFISRIRNICHIHEDVVMHTCNLMKTPNLALHDDTVTCLSSHQ
jgi:hypothetical protein